MTNDEIWLYKKAQNAGGGGEKIKANADKGTEIKDPVKIIIEKVEE